MNTEQLMGCTLIPVSIIGIICNWLVVLSVFRNSSLSHSFSLLTANQAVFNGLSCLVYMFYVVPMIILNLKIFKSNSHICGFFLVIFYDVSIQAHFLISMNRFLAVFLPVQYATIFSRRCTKLWILSSFLFSLCVLSFVAQQNCRIYYSDETWRFMFSDSPICQLYSKIGDMGKFLTICTLNTVIDSITIWRVRSIRKLARSQRVLQGAGPSALEKKEVEFLKQSFGQASFLFCGMLVYEFGPQLSASNVVGFLCQTFSWCSVHALGGVFTLIFNSEIRGTLTKGHNDRNLLTSL